MTLAFRGISKRYGGVQALDDASFDVAPGEVHALAGANGAGKSTLMKILAGLVAPDDGEIMLAGCSVRIRSPLEAHRLGIGLIPQEITLCENLSVAENMYLGRYDWLNRGRLETSAREALTNLGVSLDPSVPVSKLSVAQKQLVQIARSLAYSPKILALDEPTSSLSESDVESLFAVLQRLRSRGVTMLFVTHRLKEIQAIADRVTVLRDGRVVSTLPASTERQELVRLMAGRDVPLGRSPSAAGNELMTVSNVRGISFVLRRGEILGCFGLVGAGRTELAQAIFGIEPDPHGEIRLEGRRVTIDSPRDAIGHGVGLVPEDRRLQGLFLNMAILPNVAMASMPAGPLSPATERSRAAGEIERLRIRCTGPDQGVGQLSGGNQQKVVLARWLETQPRVLILDEPTKGIDVAAKAEIQTIVRTLALNGTGILLISSELEEIQQMSDRILVFREGRITGEFAGGAAADSDLMAKAAL